MTHYVVYLVPYDVICVVLWRVYRMQSDEDLLKRIEIQEETAKEFGFYWEDLNQLLEQIQSECSEIQEAYQKNDLDHLEEEVGDLLLAAVSLSIFCRLDPKETLLKSSDKFQGRYDRLVSLVQQDGHHTLRGKSLKVLLSYWERAKHPLS